MTAPRFQMPGAMVVLATSVACGAIWGYFGELLDRTQFGTHLTSIGSDVILATYAVCAIAVVLALLVFLPS